ncbi:MAG: peptide ABC transporter substrate-binding protein [Coriobacteriia bacterium]
MSGRLRSTLVLVVCLALAFAMVGGAAGCAAKKTDTTEKPATDEPVKGGTLRYYVGEPAYIDPYNTQESEGTQVEQALFDSLTAFDALDASKIIPAAAESWQPNADATVWTFKLRADGKFADGTPVTAQDFVYAWNRIANPKTLNTGTGKADPSVISYHLGAVKGYGDVQAGKATEMSGVKAIDDTTLEVTLTYAFADFEYVVAHPALAPVPKALVEGGVDYNGAKVPFGDMPIGNGPFKMAEPWKHGQYIKTVANENYAGDAPLLDGIEFRSFKDPDTAYLEFEGGNLDFAQIGEGKIDDAKTKYGVSSNGYTVQPGKQALLGAENSVYYLLINTPDPFFKNPDVRKAVSLAINRQAICDTIFSSTREPADNIIPPGIAGYEKGVWADSVYDVAAAKKALADAGYPDGTGAPQFGLSFNADGGHQKIMELVQSDLAVIGLKAKIDSTPDFATYLKQLDAGKVQIGRLGWSADYPIADNFLYPLFLSTSTDNYSKYANTEIDKQMVDARKITDGAERIKAWQAIDKTIGEALPVIPVMFYKHHHVGSERVHDLTYSAMNLADFPKAWLTGGGK